MGDATQARRLALFSELIELDPQAREARMVVIEAESPELAAALQRMLAADAEAEGLLDRSLPGLPTELGAARGHADWETCRGEQLGPYRLLEPLGEGGMGEVWAAQRTDGVYEQRVALKLLKRGLDTQSILRRFVQERHILARLQHPGIVRLLDGGMSEGGRPWYAMERVEGDTLLRHASARSLDLRARVELLAQIADAVAYAHARLVVHRDLKPGNVMIDAAGRPRLLDFGIAKLLEDSGEDTLTGTGVRVLSPAYAAPEQILGEPVSTATDVYALGVLGYELLSGRLPHQRSSREMAALAGEVSRETQSLRASQAVAASHADEIGRHYGHVLDPVRLARQLRGDLDHILAMALRPEPERRYAGAAEFAAELRAWLQQRPVLARGDSAGYRTRRFMRRHAGGVAAAGIVLLALIGGLGSALWQAKVATAALAEAEAATARARTQAEVATAMQSFLVRSFGSSNPGRARDGANLNLGDFVEATLARIEQELTVAPSARLELRSELAQVLVELGREEAAVRELDRVLVEHREGRGRLPEGSLASTLHDRASVHVRAREFEPARALIEEALQILAVGEASGADVAPRRLAIRTTMGILATATGDHALGLEIAEGTLRDRIAVNGVEDVRSAVDYLNRCVARTLLAQHAEAESDCAHAETLLLSSPSAPRARIAWIRNAQAILLRNQRRNEEAIRSAEEGLAVVREYLGEEHPIGIGLANTRVRALSALGRFDEALALDEAIANSSAFRAELARNQLGGALRRAYLIAQLGRSDDALALLEPAVAAEPDRLSLMHLRARHVLAALRQINGDHEGARVLSDALLPEFDRAGLAVHDERALLLLTLADIEAAAGREDLAAQRRGQAADMLEQVFGSDSPRIAEAMALDPITRLVW
ncbi:MAG: protein kinase [Aquimonas sp.]|nr:protein kinase [Aquimonas sp.]